MKLKEGDKVKSVARGIGCFYEMEGVVVATFKRRDYHTKYPYLVEFPDKERRYFTARELKKVV